MAALLALSMSATVAGAEGFNLSWDDCGTFGTDAKTFTCTQNSGQPWTMVGSFVPPPGVDEFIGMSGVLTMRASWGGTLPDWWRFGTGQCRPSGLFPNFNFTGGPFECADPYYGLANGSWTYDIGYGGADRARLRVQCAVPYDSRSSLDPGTQWYAFKLVLGASKSTGTGSCAGCDQGVTISLDTLQLMQPSDVGNNPILTTALDRGTIQWQSATPPSPNAPVINSFSPTSGGPGTVVTVLGAHFIGTTAVHFGELPANFIVLSNSDLEATAPPGVITGPISVTTPEGTDYSTQYFLANPYRTGINLSWNDCGDAGSQTLAFACNENAGAPFPLIASFGPPANIREFLGLSGEIHISNAGGNLPDWWRFGTGQCRGATLVTSADFVSGPFTCADFWSGRAAGGMAYDVGYGSPGVARLRVQYAIAYDDRDRLTAGVEYYGFRVQIPRSLSTGAGSCTGCTAPMCITLDNIQLFQDVDQNNDPTLSNPMERNFVHWQNNPLACPMTVAAASLVSAEAEPALVRLAWQIEMESATLQRRARGAAWTDLARLFPDGSHRVRYEDRDVSPGVTYGYRLRVPVPAGEVYAGETEVTVPAATELALGAPSWDRTASRLGFALTLPRAGTASIEIFDVSGRRWTTRRLEGLAAGSHEVGVDIPLGLASGVYFARLTHASAAVTRSFVLTR